MDIVLLLLIWNNIKVNFFLKIFTNDIVHQLHIFPIYFFTIVTLF